MKLYSGLLFILSLLALFSLAACGDDDDDNDDASSVDDDDDDSSGDDDDDDNDDDNDDNDNDDNDNDDNDDTDPGDPIEPTAGFLSRQAEYLAACDADNAPPDGGVYGQVCRVYNGETTYSETAIQESLAAINAREDTSDFDLNSLLRLLYLDRDRNVLPASLKADIEAAVLNFKYWLDETGPDTMCWWSENHQILFHSAELLAGQLFPDDVFPNAGMTGAEHVAHALPQVLRWLDFRGKFGFSEWHSNVYFNEDMPALVNLVDFAEDETARTKAAMTLDILAFDMAANYYHGLYATTHGRTYQSHLLGGLSDSTDDAAWIMLGLGTRNGSGNFSATHLATSDFYWPPAVLEDVANDALDELEHRQRDSIDIADGPDYGIGYEDWDDILFWWGATGYVAPDIVTGTFDLVENFDMWDGFMWSDIAFLRFLVGSPLLKFVSTLLEPMSRGVALETMGTYTYRTPDYQLSGAQDYNPGMWTAQIHIWQATIDADAYVFTSYPGGLADDYMAGPWTGGWTPRATMFKNVGVFQYRRPDIPLLDQYLFVDYSHAYFPKNEFDELVQDEHWTIGRKGDAYVALYSQEPPVWSTENDYELIADARENVWLVELGDAAASGSFAQFVTDIQNAAVTIGDAVTYESPSRGTVEVGYTGAMVVDGETADLGPYARFDNPYCYQEFGDNVTAIELGTRRLQLDFQQGRRRYWAD